MMSHQIHLDRSERLSKKSLFVTLFQKVANFFQLNQNALTECQSFVDSVGPASAMSADELSNRVQSFYRSMSKRLPGDIMVDVENYVMSHLYKDVFCLDSTDDEKQDLAIQKRIRDLHWVTTEMLFTPLDEKIPEVCDNIFNAITDLIEMDVKEVPNDKLDCIANCIQHIRCAIKADTVKVASPHDIIPMLIYVVLRSNPPRLQSNIQYISRFCNSLKLVSREVGYYFSSLCTAVEFIEDLDAHSLNVSSDHFRLYMQD